MQQLIPSFQKLELKCRKWCIGCVRFLEAWRCIWPVNCVMIEYCSACWKGDSYEHICTVCITTKNLGATNMLAWVHTDHCSSIASSRISWYRVATPLAPGAAVKAFMAESLRTRLQEYGVPWLLAFHIRRLFGSVARRVCRLTWRDDAPRIMIIAIFRSTTMCMWTSPVRPGNPRPS